MIPIAVTYFMMWYSFSISALGNPLYTMVYYSAAYILFSTAYTLVVVPHTAMLPELRLPIRCAHSIIPSAI